MLQVAPEHTAITTVGKKLENADFVCISTMVQCFSSLALF